MQLNKQIDTMKRLPTLEIMKYINELLKELQSRNCYVLDFENPDCSLDHIEYHAAEGWLPKGKTTPATGDGTDNLYCFFENI